MAHKRSRGTFETEHFPQQSPLVVYGTPLPPSNSDARDDGSYVPVWKQEVRDDQGRKRLHGAFTGGFSAGYFNTVGSKEGWTPATFVSSRSKRLAENAETPKQKPEDFMDAEDLAEADEAQVLHTNDDFAGLGRPASNQTKAENIMGLLRSPSETKGFQLLRQMGWLEGQAIGYMGHKSPVGNNCQVDGQQHPPIPHNDLTGILVNKSDRMGLGLDSRPDLKESKSSISDKPSKRTNSKSSGFGVGILNDNGSDDEDPYGIGPQLSYNRVIGGDKKNKKKKKPSVPRATAANPLLGQKPVFVSQREVIGKDTTQYKCHDGRLPLSGFILSLTSNIASLSILANEKFAPLKVPEGWISALSKSDTDKGERPQYQSTAEIAAKSNMDHHARGALLGETSLPGKSVFDFLTPNARSQIATASKRQDLPPARSEILVVPGATSRTLRSLIPPLPQDIAKTALGRTESGWMPYDDDPIKKARYDLFLQIKAGDVASDSLPGRAPRATNDEWVAELHEFVRAAHMFKPMTGSIASRFVTSGGHSAVAADVKANDDQKFDHSPAPTPESSANEAARLGMFGPLTRRSELWYPTRLLCKRFNVNPPEHASPGEDGTLNAPGNSRPSASLDLLGQDTMKALRLSSGLADSARAFQPHQSDVGNPHPHSGRDRKQSPIDSTFNAALEAKRPGDEIFKAVFGSDSETEQS